MWWHCEDSNSYRKNIAQQCTNAYDVIVTRSTVRVLLLVCLKEFGVLLHCCVPSNQFGSVVKLLRARNTSRHEQPLNMTKHKITRHVTTHADNNDWGGGCAHISIHSYYHMLHHICSTNVEESCTCKLAATLDIAQFRWISALTDRCSLVYPQVFYNHKCSVAWIF